MASVSAETQPTDISREGHKRCSLCGEVKPFSEYGKHSKSKDGFNQRCKPCRRESRKASDAAFRERHRERLREYNREWLREWREEHRDAAREKSRQWYASDLERARKQSREAERRRYAEKPEVVRAARRRWYRQAMESTSSTAKVSGPWTDEEDAVLLQPEVSAREAALMLGRTLASTSARRRRLLSEEDARRRSKEQRERDQERTLPRATNWGKRWTGPELELIANYDYSAVELGLMLGRTADAVETQRYEMQKDPRKARLAGLDTDVARLAD